MAFRILVRTGLSRHVDKNLSLPENNSHTVLGLHNSLELAYLLRQGPVHSNLSNVESLQRHQVDKLS
jgi:hypothetical protein